MANGAAGRFLPPAAHPSGPGYSCLGGGVTARRLDQGATTALASEPREKTAVSKCVKFYGLFITLKSIVKLREREGQRVGSGRSLKGLL